MEWQGHRVSYQGHHPQDGSNLLWGQRFAPDGVPLSPGGLTQWGEDALQGMQAGLLHQSPRWPTATVPAGTLPIAPLLRGSLGSGHRVSWHSCPQVHLPEEVPCRQPEQAGDTPKN